MRSRAETKQLRAEIKACIEEDYELTGYRVVAKIHAPPMTVRWNLARMVELGELQARKKDKAIYYRLPVAALKPGRHGNVAPPKQLQNKNEAV